jgi:hypothetical protein
MERKRGNGVVEIDGLYRTNDASVLVAPCGQRVSRIGLVEVLCRSKLLRVKIGSGHQYPQMVAIKLR